MPKKVFISQATNRASRGGQVNFARSEQEAQRALAEVDNPEEKERELEARADATDSRQRLFSPNAPYMVGRPQDYGASQQV